MVNLTRPQRQALAKLYRRLLDSARPASPYQPQHGVQSYRAFRRTVQPGWDCVMVRWCGMWIGIEPDGYTHS